MGNSFPDTLYKKKYFIKNKLYRNITLQNNDTKIRKLSKKTSKVFVKLDNLLKRTKKEVYL